AAVSELAVRLSEYSGFTVAGRVYPNYDALVADLQSEAVHITWLPPLTYLWAHAEGLAQPALLVNRYGVYFFGTQFMANVNSGFTQYFDPQTNRSDTDASVALQQLAGKVPCWVEPGSLSGYLLPAALLQENDIQVEEGAMLRSHTAIVRALYVREICDFGVSFAISGDPRTSPSVQDLPAVMEQIVIIWRSEAIIPNLTLALHARMGADMHRSLTDAFLDIGSTPEGRQLISRAIGDDVQGLRETDDSAYDRLRAIMSGAQVELRTLIGK
ncbi:MAG: PhnD/SsuA/transferrin family substrate-binding protein, partial [Anaerolineaceae bacterium]|nr:PhnD/SsuA/transferrin family substrate-binding protein [Anaerolineaceae bacterium]